MWTGCRAVNCGFVLPISCAGRIQGGKELKRSEAPGGNRNRGQRGKQKHWASQLLTFPKMSADSPTMTGSSGEFPSFCICLLGPGCPWPEQVSKAFQSNSGASLCPILDSYFLFFPLHLTPGPLDLRTCLLQNAQTFTALCLSSYLLDPKPPSGGHLAPAASPRTPRDAGEHLCCDI